MATLTIRNLDEDVKMLLRLRAAHNKRSMEEEARAILRAGVGEIANGPRILEAARRRFGKRHGVELELPPRLPPRDPPTFE
jgi:antitoxin FitA